MIYDLFATDDDPDPQPPAVGDLIVTARLVKLVTEVAPVDSRVWLHRWRLSTRTIGPRKPWPTEALAEVLVDGAKVHHSTTYARGETPASVARANGCHVTPGS